MSQMDRRQALKLLTALGVTGLAAGCNRNTNTGADEPVSGNPISIGLIAPQTGGYKPIGDEIIKGFQLFLELNGQQLGGHPVNLVTADEGETAESGKAALDRLLKQGVLALTGVVDPLVMLGIRDAVEQARVPLIGSNASPSALQSVVYIWRTSYVSDEPGRALGPYVASQKNSRIGIIAPDYEAGHDAVKGFREAFDPSDRRISAPVIWTPFHTTPPKHAYDAHIDQLLKSRPDAVYCVYAGAPAIEFVKQLRAAGYRGPTKKIYAPGFLTEGTVLDELGNDAKGIQTALNYSADLNNAANRRFATAFRKAHGTSPTTYAVASYDAAQVLDKAIRLVGEQPTPQEVNLAIGKIGQIDSPRGAWQFNQPRTPQQKWYLREVRHDGQVLSNVLLNELATLG